MSAMSLQICVYSVPKQHILAALGTSITRNYSSDVNVIRDPEASSLKRGTGGRSSFSGLVATVFGASGFLGRYLVNRLGKIGTQVIIPYRGDHYYYRQLKVCGDLGQILFQPFELTDHASIRKAVKHSNVVINLIGRDWETKNFKFRDVHVDGAKAIARACREAQVERLIHISALNGSPAPKPIILKAGSKWLHSKHESEQAVLDEFPDATILRPSDMFGRGDRFIRYYYGVLRRQLRWLPLWHNGERTVKQPVCAADVAQGIINALKDSSTKGKIYQAVGPYSYQLGDLVDWFHREMRKVGDWGYRRYDMRYDPTFLLKARLVELISPNQPLQNLHLERIEREYITDVVNPAIPTLEDLNVNLTTIEDHGPWVLRQFRALQYYAEELGEFEDPAPPKRLTEEERLCY